MKRYRKKEKGPLLLIVILIALISFIAVGLSYLATTNPFLARNTIITTANDSLQFNVFYPTVKDPEPTENIQANPPPKSSGRCSHDTGEEIPVDSSGQAQCSCQTYVMICENRQCISASQQGVADSRAKQVLCYGEGYGDLLCAQTDGSLTGFCVAKPIIYLYPTSPIFVDVKVETPGSIVVSDPTYPEGGWKNVLANPDGKLVYENKTYQELFYETDIKDFIKPQNGIIIPKNELQKRLQALLHRIGLNEWESSEFMEFWVPRLHDLNSEYILFSLVEKDSKEKIDKVIVNPEPDTRIEFIAYFKPLDVLSSIEPLVLPNRPERVGFTMVEWGGILDNKPIKETTNKPINDV